MPALLLIALLGLACLWAYRRLSHKWGFFKQRGNGIAEAPIVFPFGGISTRNLVVNGESMVTANDWIYQRFKNVSLVGSFVFSKPYVVINDLELAKRVLVSDFDHFIDRRPIEVNEAVGSNKYFSNMLMALKGEKWRKMRILLTPIFTSGKLKAMTDLVQKVGIDLEDHLNDLAIEDQPFEAKRTMADFTTDTMCSCGLGVEAKAFKDPEGKWRRMITRLMGVGGTSATSMARVMFIVLMPKLAALFRMEFFDKDSSTFVINAIRASAQERKRTKIKRGDFIDLIIEAVDEDDDLEVQLIANCFLLFMAGFDTSSTIMACALYHLAQNQDVQEKLHKELETKGEVTSMDYATIQSLPFLEAVLLEAMRLFPIAGMERLCAKDYKVPNLDFIIPREMMVQIPASAMMKDEKHFGPEPDRFNPERDALKSNFAFMAFGQGPRSCIGMRFAMLITKIAVAKTIEGFRVLPCSKTVEKLLHDQNVHPQPKGGVWIKVQKRE